MSGGKFVDGNRNTRQSLENAIRGTGYEVRQARNGNYYFVNKETGKIYDNRKGKDQTRIETKEEQELSNYRFRRDEEDRLSPTDRDWETK